MQVKELKEKLEKGKTIEELVDVKSYLPFVEKKMLCNSIIGDCLEEDDGILMCDYFTKKIAMDIGFIVNYSDIELGEDFVEEYDFLVENKVAQYIFSNIDEDEMLFMYSMVNEVLNEKLRINRSIESVLSKGMSMLIQRIPTDKQIKSIIKLLSKELKTFEPEKLKSLQDMMKSISKI